VGLSTPLFTKAIVSYLKIVFSDIGDFMLTQVNDIFTSAAVNNRYPKRRQLTAVEDS